MTINLDPFEVMEQRSEQERNDVEKMHEKEEQDKAKSILGVLVQQDQYVGETLRMDFRDITVQVHDHHRKSVGGIPHLSYLVASRIQHWKSPINWKEEDSSVLLLRVIGAAPMPSDMMDTIIRAEAARRATGNNSEHWEAIEHMDSYTRYQLSFAGLKCEVVGTFYLGKKGNGDFELKFGTDINNFYPNSGLKVYKPIKDALETIVNFRDPTFTPEHPLKEFTVQIGHVRYASTNRPMQGVDEVPVGISPVDLLAQRTALFGMSRTGKSNTTKIVARSIYHLRNSPNSPVSVGQLIFDYNGEYANENTQGGSDVEANALKNVWRERYDGVNDVVTYGLSRPKNDPERRLLQINAFGNKVRDWNNYEKTIEDLDMLCVGKNILGDLLTDDSAKYVKNFCEVDLSVPDNITDGSKQTRYRRAVLIYRALLKKAGLDVPNEMTKPDILGLRGNGLFGKDLTCSPLINTRRC
ncbi:helicase HerA domain-containing protein [Dickeya zeae]|uniref:helicase HerA domain-containing protein n=1 Tax=Dickeya zeae TaxID=204042 RepID=UPI000C9BB46C|nr:DUF87 domain-containing protein [Dickeya zeae]AUQ27393.1 hypothetical protein C1O30_21135 [Dickeya zeae]UJR60447.1 DUF87 domain-containing protein [Dickeya zeae]